MPTTLTDALRRRLDQTLAQWRSWHCDPPPAGPPQPVRLLGAGQSNTSVLVEGGTRFVVRLDGERVAANGLNRQAEWRTLLDAHAAGIAPCPRYFNPDLGSLVCDYLPPDPAQPVCGADIGDLLRRIHALPPRHHRLDLAERLQRYARQLASHAAADELLGLGDAIGALLPAREEAAASLCHNDLLAPNRLYSDGRLFALDWEYSAVGSPWYDLAAVAHGDDLAPADAGEMLRHYLGREPGDAERAQLARYGCIYRYLELLWYAARDGGATAPARLAALRDLLARLD
jgi:aminoglycoside phosphotransferase (APT) family kinase protein